MRRSARQGRSRRTRAQALEYLEAILLPEDRRLLVPLLDEPAERRAARSLRAAFGGYAAIARDRVFLGYAVLPGLVMGVLLAYVSGSSWVFQREHGLTTGQLALVFAVVGVAQVVVAQLNAALVPRLGPVRLLRVGLPLATVLAGVLVVVAVTGVGGVVGLVVVLWLIVGSIGIIMSNAAALALSRHGERAGSAAAVIGFLQAGGGGVIGSLVGLLGGGAVAMAAVIAGAFVVALAVLALGTPAYRSMDAA